MLQERLFFLIPYQKPIKAHGKKLFSKDQGVLGMDMNMMVLIIAEG